MAAKKQAPEKEPVLIIDVTRMGGGNVCIAGVDASGSPVRPVLGGRRGISESSLFDPAGKQVIKPWRIIGFTFVGARRAPPHIEDRIFTDDPPPALAGRFDRDAVLAVLQNTCFPSISELFDGCVRESKYIMPGAPTRSLGTIRPKEFSALSFPVRDEKRKFRLEFTDQSGKPYMLQVTDLRFRNFCAEELESRGVTETRLSVRLAEAIRSAEWAFLRIGLARPWLKDDAPEKRCYIQINGVHTYPDYKKAYRKLCARPVVTVPGGPFKGKPAPTRPAPGPTRDEEEKPGTRYIRVSPQKLFSALFSLRRRLAEARGVKPADVFSDAMLLLISREQPVNVNELRSLSGINPAHVDKYGADFVRTIRKFRKAVAGKPEQAPALPKPDTPPPPEPAAEKPDRVITLTAEQKEMLFDSLRILRNSIAEREKIKRFEVFQNRTLEAMAAAPPTCGDEFLALPGVGTVKLQKYGELFLERIREFVRIEIGERKIGPERDKITVGGPVAAEAPAGGEPGVEDWGEDDQDELFESLRRLRFRFAKSENVRAFVVFHDVTLREMARRRPVTEEEFLALPRAGPAKWKKYGAAFMAEIKKHQRTEVHFAVGGTVAERADVKYGFIPPEHVCRLCGENKLARGVVYIEPDYPVCMDCYRKNKTTLLAGLKKNK